MGPDVSPKSEAEQFNLRLPVKKLDAAEGLFTGWAALSSDKDGTPVIDWQNEYAPVDELRKAAHDLVTEGGRGRAGEMHDKSIGDIVDSMVIDKPTAKALGFGDGTVEGWAVTLKVLDDAAKDRVSNGSRPELSILGSAIKRRVGERDDGSPIKALSKLKIDEISIVDAGASGNESVSPRIVIAKRRTDPEVDETVFTALVRKLKQFFVSKQQEPTMPTLEEILANMSDEEKSVILAAIEAAKAAPPAPPEQPVPTPPAPPPAAPSPEEMMKALKDSNLPEPVRKALEQQLEESEDDNEREELRKRVDQLEAEREFDGFVAKAKKLPHLAGKSTEQVAKLLQAASKKLEGKDYENVVKLLETADAAVAKSTLLRDNGSPLPADENSPDGQLEAVAKSLREKNPELTKEAAMVKAAEEHPDLYAARREAQA